MIRLLTEFAESKIGLLYFKLSHFASVYIFSLLVLLIRIWMAKIFWYSGLTKISSFNSTIYLFKYEYKVPFISPEIAAYMATTIELSVPSFLVIGLFSRLACLPLIVMTLVIQFTYLQLVEHLYWLFLLCTVLFYGPGRFSLDHWLYSKTHKKINLS